MSNFANPYIAGHILLSFLDGHEISNDWLVILFSIKSSMESLPSSFDGLLDSPMDSSINIENVSPFFNLRIIDSICEIPHNEHILSLFSCLLSMILEWL